MRKGFTLIELIVVIAIIAVLAAIVAPNAFKAIEKGKISATVGDYKSIKTGAMAYYADTGQWPADNNNNGAGFVTDDNQSGWDGPYLEKWPARAAWGGTYTFNSDGNHNWDGVAGGDQARYLAVTSVTQTAFDKMDMQLDGTSDAAAGSVQYDANNSVLYLLVSID